MTADIIDLWPILLREFPDQADAKRDADRALHFAVQRYKSAHGERMTIARLRQIAAVAEYFMGVEDASSRPPSVDHRGGATTDAT